MLHCIVRLIDPLRRLLWPPPTVDHCPVPRPRCPPRPTRAPAPYYRGEDSPFVRPYLLAHERRQAEARRRHLRRRALWITAQGVDAGPFVIHGREMAA
ncbi:hypothetical protein OTC26_008855 [Streptomyces tirandamycinicus]|uniref:hypothetical protein n=1 Tax=Streptomyces tirandamycinicus TaxID=2174846 RepID=UPI00227095C6|nr:hypothetical protein [Streptomyces tirandamycinicus]MCY0983506.1 hypothetical protein [Streptomyces tirandamycinicus]